MPGPYKSGVADWITVRLESAAGADVTGVVFNDASLSFLIQKAGGAAAAKAALTAPDWIEIGKGFYKVALTATDLNTAGQCALVATYATVSLAVEFRVLANDLADAYARMGAPAGASLAADIATRAPSATALSTAQWTNGRAALLDNADAAVSSRAAAATAVSSADLTPTRAAKLDQLDAAVSSRLAGAGYTAPDNAGIAALAVTDAAIKAKTDNLPAAPASETTSAAIKARTDLIPAAPASEGNVTAVGALATAIKAKTDALPASPANEATVAAVQGVVTGNGIALALLGAQLGRALGLLDENTVREPTTFDGADITEAEIRCYDSAAHATADDGVTGLEAAYVAAYIYSAPGVLAKATVTRVS